MNTVPRYLIFAGDIYYPNEGFKDMYGSASTLEEAIEIAKEAVEVGRHRPSTPKDELPPLPPDMYDELTEAARIATTTRNYTELARIHSTYRVYEPPETCPCDWAQIVDLNILKIIADVTDEADAKEEQLQDLQDLSYPPLKPDEEVDEYEEYENEYKKNRVAKFVWY